MGDALLEHGAGGELGVQVHRVAVAGDFGEQLDVALGDIALEGGLLADFEFFVSDVLNLGHGVSSFVCR
ncbi:hypothetical protein D3C81_2032900 [compost metagenome]